MVLILQAIGEPPGPERRRAREQRACVTVCAAGEAGDRVGETLGVLNACRAHRGKIAILRLVRALVVQHARYQLWDHEIQVGVALPMRMCGHVHRHACEPRREIGAVIKVVAAREILIGFAVARMLRDDQPRHGFQHFARAQQRTLFDPFARGRALACSIP